MQTICNRQTMSSILIYFTKQIENNDSKELEGGTSSSALKDDIKESVPINSAENTADKRRKRFAMCVTNIVQILEDISVNVDKPEVIVRCKLLQSSIFLHFAPFNTFNTRY